MGRLDILTDDDRRRLFDVPNDHVAMVKLYTLSRFDLDMVHLHRSKANRLGFAVQLALLPIASMKIRLWPIRTPLSSIRVSRGRERRRGFFTAPPQRRRGGITSLNTSKLFQAGSIGGVSASGR